MTSLKPKNESTPRSYDEQLSRLLPGLPNDIVFDHIVRKLPWRTFHILSSVSRSWRQVIQSRQVYDSRVGSHSTETLVVLNHTDDDINVMSLYSVRDDSWHLLPPFPKSRKSQKGIPEDSQCVSLDGKIYVLGGVKKNADLKCSESCEVHVFDVAGQREWKRCADMPQCRSAFGCGVAHGKIYVFAGVGKKPMRGSAVYDPKADAWSSIMPMSRMRSDHHVVTVGEEMFVHGGRFHGPTRDPSKRMVSAEVYHPGKDEWRLLKAFGCHKLERLFAVEGKLRMITPEGIFSCDVDGNDDGKYSLTLLHKFSFEVDPEDTGEELDVEMISVVNGELVGLLTFSTSRESQTGICRSIGFGSEKDAIVWETISSELLSYHQFPYFMCTVEL